MLFSFEDYEVDSEQLELRRAGVAQSVEPQVFSLLELLVANSHRVVSKEEINEAVWGGRIVSEAALSSRIRSVRQAIGDDGRRQRLVRTIRDRGFRFVGEVTTHGTTVKPVAVSPSRADVQAGPSPGADEGVGVVNSIAVLPLLPLTDDSSKTPLADAISHEIITELSRLRWLRVIARGSSFRFRGADVDLRDVGRILEVGYVLSGSFSVFGGECVITLELAKPESGEVAWADRVEVALSELMSLRVRISSRIATAIEGRIQAEEAMRAASLSTEHLDSWAAYFRGLWHVNRFNAHDNDIAEHLFRRSIEADPSFARAHAGLSFAHFQNAFVGYRSDRTDQVSSARRHAELAYELDSSDPFTNLTMGRVQLLNGQWDAAAPWFDRTTELNSNYALAFYHRALADAVSARGEDAPELAVRAISLSPVDPMRYAMLGARALAHVNRGEPEEAAAWGVRAASEPNAHVLIWMIAAMTAELAGDREGAASWADRVQSIDRPPSRSRFFQAFPFARAEMRESIDGALIALGL